MKVPPGAARAPDSGAAAERGAARALARQKAWATGLVVFCALVYAGTKALEVRHPAIPYVAAFAEAAIIGALADWYAVVALFRHPLGLKLPHTAIIPANQERIAENLGDFIAKHFLAGPRVGERVQELDPAAGAGRWIAEPGNRQRVAAHAARLLPQAIAAIDRDTLRSELERGVLERLAEVDMVQVIGTSLEIVTRNQRHHAILDELLGRIESLLAEPATLGAIRDRIRRELPTLARFFLADAFLVQRLVGVTHALLKDVRRDPAHPLRGEFDRFVAEFVAKIRNSPEYREKVEGLKQELLARAELREILVEGWDRFVGWLRQDVEREQGVIRRGFDAFLIDVAGKLQYDARLRARLNRWLAESASAVTERYKQEVARFVAAQVRSWDTRHAVRTIELSLGKDLQYIRINGTVVGGLIGLVIFTVTHHFLG